MVAQGTNSLIGTKDVASLLVSLRESKQLTIAEVSNLLRIPQQTLENIESGSIESHLEQIYGLLCLYGEPTHKVFGGFFDQELPSTRTNEVLAHVLDCITFHKKLRGQPLKLSTVPKARGKAEGRYTDLSGKPSQPKHKPKKTSSSAVLEVRAQWVISEHKLYRLPINIFQVLDNLGVNLVFESFPSSMYMQIKGFCYKENEFSLIGINKSHPTVLQRYSVAHELHHILYDFDNKFLCGPNNEQEASELDAERFAAELLMPRSMVERLITNPLNISYLTVHLVAKHFGVSYEAAAIRLAKFGLVDSSKEVCERAYRKKDKQKTEHLLKNKVKYLIAVFGLETGITELLNHQNEIGIHSLCGAPVTDPSHTVCWQCGLELNPPSSKQFCLKNPYRQNPANLLSTVASLDRRSGDATQLSLNLSISNNFDRPS